ncbi:MAG: DUF4124 domain-containing protein [Betaproteobacteria bacterium]
MQPLAERKTSLIVGVLLALFAFGANAQGLWKYTDKNGKVTYSDTAPKNGEKAEPVIADTTGTVIPAERNLSSGKVEGKGVVSSRSSDRVSERENYRKALDSARDELEKAKKALEDGQEPTQDERIIVVGRGVNGQSTGVNAINRKPEYYSRIASLEEAVKKSEEKVTAAERDFRQKAPQ